MVTVPPPRSAMPGMTMFASQRLDRTLDAMIRSKASVALSTGAVSSNTPLNATTPGPSVNALTSSASTSCRPWSEPVALRRSAAS